MLFHQVSQSYGLGDFLKLINQEYAIAKHQFETLKKSHLGNSLANGDVLGPLKPIQLEEKSKLVFRYHGYITRYRKGDMVDVHTLKQNKLDLVKNNSSICDVKFPKIGQIEVSLSIKDPTILIKIQNIIFSLLMNQVLS